MKLSDIEKIGIIIFIGLLLFALYNNRPQETYKYKPKSQIESLEGE